MGAGDTSFGAKAAEASKWSFSLSSAEVKDEWNDNSTSLHALMAYIGINILLRWPRDVTEISDTQTADKTFDTG